MLAKVVKPFPYYGDGVTLENLNVGDERDFGTMTDGLVRAGFVSVGEAPVEQTAEPLTEPPLETKPAIAVEPRRGRPRK